MSWRETLGVTPSTETRYAHNSQNTQKPTEQRNCADIADSAYRNSEEESSRLFENLADACRGLGISPAEVKEALAPEDIEDWRNGDISTAILRAFARALVDTRDREAGRVPCCYTEFATCRQCGPVWLWFSGEVDGCPWCWNRLNGKTIPRPSMPS